MIYQFNQIKIDSDNFKLVIDQHETPVEPQVFNLIIYLIQNKDRIISRHELLEQIWHGRVVSDTSINNNIKSARKVLGDDGSKQQVIKTIHSRGYQFVADIKTQVISDTTINPTKKTEKTYKTTLLITLTTVFLAIYFGYPTLSKWMSGKNSNVTTTLQTTNELPESNSQITAHKLIAVLPFANTKPHIETDFLGFALANQIISDLTYLENFAVRPAGSIRKYTNQSIDTIAVGKELEADYIISGNYLIENDTVRLNVEMIKVNNSYLVWRESMEVAYSDTFSLQDMVAQKVAKGLDVGFNQNFLNQQHRDIPNSALSYEYYLRGISYPQSNEGHMLAVKMLQKSIQLDPKYAPSYAHLGFHRRLLEQHGRIAPKGLNKSEWYYQKALSLNPQQLEALSNLSALYTETNRTEDAMMVTRKMIEINPGDANSHFALGYIYRYAGMLNEAIEEMEKALKLSPQNTRFRSIISTYVSAGRYEEALANVFLDPGDYGTGYSGIIAFEQEQYDLAKQKFNQVIAIDKKGIWGLIAQVYLAHMDGNKEQGLLALSQMVDSDITDAENMYYFATFYAMFKEKESCLFWLEKAVNTGYFNYPYISRNTTFDFIQQEPRYKSALSNAKQRHDLFREKFL